MTNMNRINAIISSILVGVVLTQNLAWAGSTELTDAETREQKLQLDFRLGEIQSISHTRRLITGSVFLAAGTLFAVQALTANTSATSYTVSDTAVLGAVAAGFGVAGTLTLIFPSRFEKVPEQYRLMPESTPEELRSKITFGEISLQSLAEEAETSRLLSSGILFVLGAGYIALYAGMPAGYWDNLVFSRSVLFSGILCASVGIFTFILKTQTEREYKDYMDWKNDHGHKSGLSFNVTPILAPVPGGALTGVSLAF